MGRGASEKPIMQSWTLNSDLLLYYVLNQERDFLALAELNKYNKPVQRSRGQQGHNNFGIM